MRAVQADVDVAGHHRHRGRDINSSLVTNWTVAPAVPGCSVTVKTTWTEGGNGVKGFFERVFAPLGLRRIQDEVLANASRRRWRRRDRVTVGAGTASWFVAAGSVETTTPLTTACAYFCQALRPGHQCRVHRVLHVPQLDEDGGVLRESSKPAISARGLSPLLPI